MSKRDEGFRDGVDYCLAVLRDRCDMAVDPLALGALRAAFDAIASSVPVGPTKEGKE